MGGRLEYRRLRAPTEDGAVFLQPAGDALSALIGNNVESRSGIDVSLHGRSLNEISTQAREELLRDAQEHVQQYQVDGQVARPAPRRIYLTGHQPELFHPGVWLKNFVLDALAQRDGAAAVHVLIDNDEVRSPSIRSPAGAATDPRLEIIPFDADAPPSAWEERRIVDVDCFRTFARRAAQVIEPFNAEPLVNRLWEAVEDVLPVSANLGQALAALRHRLEWAWGVRTLEVPLSQICRSESFHWFTAFLLAERTALAHSYNQTLGEYRRVHRLRSPARPVPDLAAEDDWLEAPFWLFSAADAKRRRVFVRQTGSAIILSDRGNRSVELAAPLDGDVSRLAADLTELERRGIKLRPRALITTMYLRTVLSDLFIHGIGGAKYDQVTDCLIADLLGIEPPGYATTTGTRLLPIEFPTVSDDDIRHVDRQLRDIKFHPERLINVDEHATDARQRERLIELLEEKRRLVCEHPPPGEGRRHRAALLCVNQALADYVSNRKAELLKQRKNLTELQRASGILRSREFSLCLFSEAGLRPWLLDASAVAD